METFYKQFENCMQEEQPYCSDDCPFHLDVLDFLSKMENKRYNAAYKVFRNAAAFPDIAAALCSGYCRKRCPRQDTGGAVQLNLLEKTCIARAKRKKPNEYNLPAKKGKVAVIGGGISGLACALRIASKKYEVVVYEKTEKIGGQLYGLMPEQIFMEDIERQFQFETYTLHLNTEVKGLKELAEQGFDAVYIATGKGGPDFGILDPEAKNCARAEGMGVFAGGSLTGKNVIFALAEGIAAAWPIEVYLKTGNVQPILEKEPSKIVPEINDAEERAPVRPGDNGIFTEEEASIEAARCFRCQCSSCRTHCDLTKYFNKWPLQMRDEIMTTTMSADSMIHKTPAIRLINACTQCGLCNETCPGNIELGNMIKEARKRLHKLGRTPGAYHQFWVRDMEFANGAYASITRKAPGQETCSYAFFPGCHLGAADPGYVMESYKWLLSKQPDTGLMLGCCGLPADWSGNEELHLEELEKLRSNWEALGNPVLVMACPSCMKHLKEYLPEISMVSLYEAMEQQGVKPMHVSTGYYSVFDPCAARNEDDMRDAVRALCARVGICAEELAEGAKHGCCGFGGNVEVANPKFAKQVAQERSRMSENPYITYCINCRDVFYDEGKPVKHILDFMFDIKPESDRLPTVTERRCNRVVLKERLLKEIWGEEMNQKPELNYKLQISDSVRDKMNRLKILDEDICYVLEAGEVYGRRTRVTADRTYRCYREIGFITCWVEYRPAEEGFEILNLYTHRMKIELEAVWNGRKTETDLR